MFLGNGPKEDDTESSNIDSSLSRPLVGASVEDSVDKLSCKFEV